MAIEKVLSIPSDLDAEQAVLGSIIEDNTLANEIIKILSYKDFYSDNHQHIFNSITELVKEGKPIDEVLLSDKLKSYSKLEEVGGIAYLAELLDCAPSSGNIVYYAKIIKDHSVLRDLIEISRDIAQKARDPERSVSELLAEATNKITDIAEQSNEKKSEKLKDVIVRRIKDYEKRSEEKKDIIGMPTGFYDLDDIISGLIAPNMVSIAGDSGMGKSAFAFNIVENVYMKYGEKRHSFIVSREMSNDEIGDRFLCSSSKISSKDFKIGKIDQDKSDSLYQKAGQLCDSNIILNDHYYTFDQVSNEARYLHRHCEGGLCLMVIDYLQLLEGVSKSNREQEVSYMSRNTKRLAKELNIPIIALSQLNRDLRKRKDKRPIRSDLRESAAIEHDSDILIFIYRDEFYNKDSDKKGIAEIIIDKHRNGPTGYVELSFRGKYTKFENLAKYRM